MGLSSNNLCPVLRMLVTGFKIQSGCLLRSASADGDGADNATQAVDDDADAEQTDMIAETGKGMTFPRPEPEHWMQVAELSSLRTHVAFCTSKGPPAMVSNGFGCSNTPQPNMLQHPARSDSSVGGPAFKRWRRASRVPRASFSRCSASLLAWWRREPDPHLDCILIASRLYLDCILVAS